jgi:hypothetical protein
MRHSIVINSLPQVYEVIKEMNLGTIDSYQDNIPIDMRRTILYKKRSA